MTLEIVHIRHTHKTTNMCSYVTHKTMHTSAYVAHTNTNTHTKAAVQCLIIARGLGCFPCVLSANQMQHQGNWMHLPEIQSIVLPFLFCLVAPTTNMFQLWICNKHTSCLWKLGSKWWTFEVRNVHPSCSSMVDKAPPCAGLCHNFTSFGHKLCPSVLSD